MAIKSEDPKEYIAALGNISSLLNDNLGLGSANIANLNNVGVGGRPFLNFIPQQGPVLGPDDFGSYTIPMSDPTYRSGFDYARSIAGGMPMEQVIAPGVSYSPEQPMGYTQEQLNTVVGTTPVEPPPTQEPDDPSFLGTGIGGVNIPVDRKQIPLRDITGGTRDIRDVSSLENLLNIGKLFSGGIDQDAIDKMVQERIAESMPTFEQPDLSQFARIEDLPSLIPQAPTGKDFSVDRQQLIEDIRAGIDIPKYEAPDLSQFARLEDIPTVPTFNEEALRKELMEDIRGSINIPQMPDLSGLARIEDIPSFDPDILKQDILMSLPQTQVPDVSQFVTQDDITKAIAGIDMPTFQQPDLSAYDTRIAELEQQLAGLKQPTGGSFSISQPVPRGLF
jgi:hypothetical protein